ncbi:hypothetical protein [Streptomyces gossypiisoli]|uniref:hypothetical protein n=1 Tax=Streptomyces gossypiisoli TaxID=2748864 RepID=UPI0015DAAAF8
MSALAPLYGDSGERVFEDAATKAKESAPRFATTGEPRQQVRQLLALAGDQ